MKRFVPLTFCLLASVFATLCSNTAAAQTLTSPVAPGQLDVYTFPAAPQSAFQTTSGGAWQVTNNAGTATAVVPNLDGFTAYTFAAYSTGLSSGAVVTLTFVHGAAKGGLPNGPCYIFAVDQVETMVVDQLDGYLYMHGSFGPAGWTPGQCGYVEVTPAVPGPPITITLVGKGTTVL